jgi:hypothetical protein
VAWGQFFARDWSAKLNAVPVKGPPELWHPHTDA